MNIPVGVPPASKARLLIELALRKAIDPDPTAAEVGRLWDHFKAACAYCGRALNPDGHDWVLDGLVDETDAITGGLTHAAGNCVLSCRKCHADQRCRVRGWRFFLEYKCRDKNVCLSRFRAIEAWHTAAGTPAGRLRRLEQRLEPVLAKVLCAFDEAVGELEAAAANEHAVALKAKQRLEKRGKRSPSKFNGPNSKRHAKT